MNRSERRRQEKLRRRADAPNLQASLTRATEHQQAGRLEDAVACYDEALAVDPNCVEAHNNKGNTLKALGRLEDAIACYVTALTLKPDLAQVHYNLATVFQDLGWLSDAADRFQKTLVLQPDYAEALNNLGNVFKDLGRFDEAVASYRKALDLRPNHAPTHNNLGDGLRELGSLDDAVACFRTALDLDPGLAEAHSNLGNVLAERGRPDDAMACYRKAISLDPDNAEAYSNLGNVLAERGRLDDAAASYRKAISLKPDYAEAHNNLGNALNSLGEHQDAIACYEKALALKPDFPRARNNLLHVLLYLPELTNQELFASYRRIIGAFSTPIPHPVSPPLPTSPPGGRLRIGYVSSDFHDHPLGRNVLPLIGNHDHQRFEIFCYTEGTKHDDITSRFMHHADHWRLTRNLTDEQVAQQIRDDQIHILVYLGGHFDNNRPSVSSHHPAPVQAAMFGGTTTGLDGMDFWITDGVLNPDTTTEQFSEELIRLPSLFTYPHAEDTPPVSALPADENGFVTFVSFNKPGKMTDDVLDLWSEILTALPDARLHLKFKNYLETPSLSLRIMDRFERNAIAPDRIGLLAGVDNFQDHLAHYHQADIALDTFPFSGATTTFQALWMGVPVVSLLGERFISRMGASLSLHAGLDGVTAPSAAEYVEQAVVLANDRPRLRQLRASLRQRLIASPLCDGPGYALNMEDALRAMWAKKSRH